MPSVKKNYIWNLLYQIINMLIPIVTTPFLARTLGADAIGVSSYTTSNMGYFLLIAVLGTSLFGKRKIAYSRNSSIELNRSFWEIEIFRIITSAVTLAGYSVFILITNEYKIIYTILIISLINVVFDVTWFFEGIEDFGSVVKRNLLARICHLIFIFLFVKSPDDLWLYVLSSAGWIFVGNILICFKIPRRVTKVNKINPLRNFKEIIALFVPTIASQVFYLLDRSMIGWITKTPYENGCYAEAEKISNVACSIVAALSAVIMPKIANLYDSGDLENIKSYTFKTIRFAFFISMPMMFGLMSVNDYFIPLFLGAGYDLTVSIMPLFSVLILVSNINTTLAYSYFIPTGQEKIFTKIVLTSGLINVVTNYLAITYRGAFGAAAATLIAEIIGLIYGFIICIRKKLFNIKELMSFSIKYFLASATMFFAIITIKPEIQYGVIGLLILTFSGAIIYFLLLILLRDSFFISYIEIGIKRIIRIKEKK